jgi:hypothetical protein
MTSRKRNRRLKPEQKEFRARKEQAKLGGMWKGVKFTDEDICEVRREMWRKLEH